MKRLRRVVKIRALCLALLQTCGPLTNRELAEAVDESSDLFPVMPWHVDPQMRRLENQGLVERIQLTPRGKILWVATK